MFSLVYNSAVLMATPMPRTRKQNCLVKCITGRIITMIMRVVQKKKITLTIVLAATLIQRMRMMMIILIIASIHVSVNKIHMRVI